MLVVMAIISTLAGMILPAVAGAKEKGRRISCVNNLRQIGLALQSYADDFGGYIPTNWPAGLAGDHYTAESTNRLRPVPDMPIGLGKLVHGQYLSEQVEIFGCPSHVPYLPRQMRLQWNETGGVESAYLWRETDASLYPDAMKRLAGRIKNAYGIVMDNSTVEGCPQGNSHRWEWTNILYSDIHVRGSMNDKRCIRTVTGAPPDEMTVIDNLFTHDADTDAMTQVWQHADAEADK